MGAFSWENTMNYIPMIYALISINVLMKYNLLTYKKSHLSTTLCLLTETKRWQNECTCNTYWFFFF